MVHQMWFSLVNTQIHVVKGNTHRSMSMQSKAEIFIDWNLLVMKLMDLYKKPSGNII